MTVFLVVSFLVIFAAVLLAVGLGTRYLESERKGRVKAMLDDATGQNLEAEPTILTDSGASQAPLSEILSRTFVFRGTESRLRQAGLSWSVGALLGLMLLAGLAGALLGWRINFFIIPAVSITVTGLVFSALPYLYVFHKRNKRLSAFEQQFPEALDFLARSMRAGHAFSIGLEMLAEESPEPLGLEFRRVFNEQNLGAPLDAALYNLTVRVPLVDVRFFVSSVLLQRETGGNLSEILTKLAYLIRERFRLKGQVRAASAHGRITALILTILPIVTILALMVVAPGYLQSMARDEHGKWLIVGAVIGQGLGYYTMRRIVDIKV